MENQYVCFRPRNGEVILKDIHVPDGYYLDKFQSPQWG